MCSLEEMNVKGVWMAVNMVFAMKGDFLVFGPLAPEWGIFLLQQSFEQRDRLPSGSVFSEIHPVVETSRVEDFEMGAGSTLLPTRIL
jgi:hypothetical protein